MAEPTTRAAAILMLMQLKIDVLRLQADLMLLAPEWPCEVDYFVHEIEDQYRRFAAICLTHGIKTPT